MFTFCETLSTCTSDNTCSAYEVSPFICHVLSAREIMSAEEKYQERVLSIAMHSQVRNVVISGAMKRAVNRATCAKFAMVAVGSGGTYVPVEQLREALNREAAWQAKMLAASSTAAEMYPPLARPYRLSNNGEVMPRQ